MTLTPPPKNTTKYDEGTGLTVLKVSDLGSSSAEPEQLLRYQVFDPDTPSIRHIGVPTYQFRIVRNNNVGAGTTEPASAVLLHGNAISKIVIAPVYANGDHASSVAWLETYCDVSAVTEHATALAAVPVPDPDPVASPIEIVTTVMSIPEAADRLGVHVFARDKTGHVAPASPDISGTDLGFAGSELTDWRWKGFVALRDPDDPDLIRVLGGLEKLEVRASVGDMSKTANYVFVVKESDGSLVSGATEVTVDIPFIPSQLVSGTPKSITGGDQLTFWCIGRADAEFHNPLTPSGKRAATAESATGIAVSGGLAVWSCVDPGLGTWSRAYVLPAGVGHLPHHHLNTINLPHVESSRDVGLTYEPVSQQLVPWVVDTDPTQDPVTMWGHKGSDPVAPS